VFDLDGEPGGTPTLDNVELISSVHNRGQF
jgi:hypothetical protein